MTTEKSLMFIVERRNKIREELKGRKKWLTALNKEYWLQRTQKNEGTKQSVWEMMVTANIMIKHYEKILDEHNEMIKELNKRFNLKLK